MTDQSSAGGLFDPATWFGAKPWMSVTTGGLTQPILPGWQIGDVIVNDANSSSPATERRILAQDSYGRQIGRLMDAVCALIRQVASEQAKEDGPLKDLLELQDKIDGLKGGAVDDHVAQLRRDLDRLKARDTAAYDRAVEKLRALLPP